jgi:hypothetical protein
MLNHTELRVPGNGAASVWSPLTNRGEPLNCRAEENPPARKCSISYIGDPRSVALFITTLPFQNLTEDFELFFTSESIKTLDEPSRRLIQAKSRILDLPPLPTFEQMALETARRSAADFLVFANEPVTLDRIFAVIRVLEENCSDFASTPERSAIVVRTLALLRAQGLGALLRQPPRITPAKRFVDASDKIKFWDTIEAFKAGFGHILQIPDRTEMLRLMPQNGIVAEIGVFKGDFSAQVLSITKPALLHLIDFWPDETIQSGGEYINGLDACEFVRNRFLSEIGLKKVVLHRELSAQVAQTFPDEYFDWIYIDAGHSYQEIKSDLHCWHPKVKTGGLITGHDYIEKTGYGIVPAVNEFLRQKPLVFIALTAESHGSRSWVLKKLPAFSETVRS